MKRTVLASLALAILGLAGSPVVAGQAARGLQGVWQIAEINITGPSARTLTFPEPRANQVIFTAKHYSRVEVQSEKPRPLIPDVAKATADELRATWGPFVAEAGTYKIAGNAVTMHPIASKNPAVMGGSVFVRYTFNVSGNTLTLTQDRNQNGPFPNPFTIKAVRVE